MDFWKTLKKPIFGLAPMDGVTDAAFRRMVALYGKPDVIFTEFTSAEGIKHGAERVLDAFIYSELERPIVAQIFGADEEAFYLSAALICELGFDGIDINMGCPDKNVAKKGGGAALILNPKKAQNIIYAVKKGVADWLKNGIQYFNLSEDIINKALNVKNKFNLKSGRREIPVSVKTRIGYDKIVTEDWISVLLEVDPVAISIHGRTLKQLYSGKADWEEIKKAVSLRDKTGKETLILGNGDISSLVEAHKKINDIGVDGALVGRATFGNPWFFSGHIPTTKDKLNAALQHLSIYYEIFGDFKFHNIKKHLAWYLSGFPNSKELRMEVMKSQNKKEAEKIIKEFSKKLIHN